MDTFNRYPVDNSLHTIDSRDVISRIEQLEGFGDDIDSEEKAELDSLLKLVEEAAGSPDWNHGEVLIRDSYFTEYTEELIRDCYNMPKEIDSGDWPWRHMSIDMEAAAQELKADYFDVDFDGVTYWIRG